MAEEKAASKLQAMLAQFGEKIALGAAVGVLVLYLLLGVVLGGGDQSADKVKKAAQNIEAQSVAPHPDKAAPEFPEQDLKDKDGNPLKSKDGKPVRGMSELADVQIVKYWQDVPSKVPAYPEKKEDADALAWAGSIRPTAKGKENFIPNVAEKGVTLGSVTLEKVEPGLQGITITWSVKDASSTDKEVAAKIDEVLVERDNKGKVDKSWKFPATQTSYVDKEVEKRGIYKYRLTPITKNADYRKKKNTDRGQVTDWLGTQMMDEWIISFTNPIPNPAKGMVQVKIEKFDKVAGHVSITKIQFEGDEIGKWEDEVEYQEDDGMGGKRTVKKKEPTFKHKIGTGGTIYTVEFNTGYRLQTVKKATVQVTYLKCNKKPLSAEPCKQEPKTVPVEVVEIVYTDADKRPISKKYKGGKEVQMKSETEMDPSEYTLVGERCDEHGGDKKDDVKDPEKEKKEKLEQEARTTLAEAEQFRATYTSKMDDYKRFDRAGKKDEAAKAKDAAEKAKASAIEKYKKFLGGDYKDTKYLKEKQKSAEDALKKLTG